MIAAHALSVGYGKRTILHEVDFKAEKAQIIALIGPNGCGKSTMLRTLCGQIAPKKGSVSICNQGVSTLGPKKLSKYIAFLPQMHEVLHGVSVYELVAMGRAPYHKSGWILSMEDKKKIQWALSYMDLENLVLRPVNQLSGGEQQRVWIAMALAQDTPIILLDEPVTYMDLKFQWELLSTIRDLRDTHKKTIISVFHDINHAIEVSDYIYLFKDGRVYAQGTSEEVITEENIGDVYGLRAHVCKFNRCHRNVVVPTSLKRGFDRKNVNKVVM